jgi:methionyl-tRNA formyltransferase
MVDDLRVKLGPVTVDETTADPNMLPPGVIRVERKRVLVGTASHPVALGVVQAPGKKPMNATDWARGARLEESARAE